jgi:hypothetical protein
VGASDLEAAAFDEAARLAELPQPAFGNTKRSAHRALVAELRAGLADDLRGMTGVTA